MSNRVRGLRSIELEVPNLGAARKFFTEVWRLSEVEAGSSAAYFRGTGRYHHILALHAASGGAAVRRVVFDASDRDSVRAFHSAIAGRGHQCTRLAESKGPGGGYGFDFVDQEGRRFGIVCEVADHADDADVADRPRKIAHVNLNAVDVNGTNAFLIDNLGFSLIDQSGPLSFLHCANTDHNSVVVCGAAKPTINHIAFELPDLHAVMRGAGRMRDAGYPIEWGPGRHVAGDNVFAYFAGPEEIPLEYTSDVMQVDDSYVPHGPEYWKWPAGRMDQWGITPPHSQRWKRIQDMLSFSTAPLVD
ncbi:MAG: VOC family protein [Pseudolabrys sp.]|nr:VOC family protein [Pseudolabrys sp.]